MSKLINELRELAKVEMGEAVWDNNREPGYRYFHCIRTARLSKMIISETDNLNISDETLELIIAASLVHDIRKMEKPHALAGANYIKDYLKNKDYVSEDGKEKIVAIIEHHNIRGRKDLPNYIKVVQDADIISRYGAVTIFTECYKSGLRNSPRQKMIENKRLIDEKFHLDYSKLNFEFSKTFITKEHQITEEYYKKLEDELLSF